MAQPLSPEELGRLRQLHADGHGRNEIARRLDRSVGVVTNCARRLGLDFDRSATRAAVEARQIDLADRRQRLTELYMEAAELAAVRSMGQYRIETFDNRGEFVAQLVDLPPARETKDLLQASKAASDAAERLLAVDVGDQGRENAKGLLRTLGEAMTAASRELGVDDADEYGS
ncbi:hypothetical protein SUDANB15_02535 [Streptomyces sp. enrichment culture]|uniref:hypothetical protein n=1 Tax=Streptomyces sp. enrichment culture TaxID=1795815 RepID=UPI003F543EE0